jgi:hypothetical protein
MSQPSTSQASDNNPYADLDMYGGNSNYMDQVTNGYNQMNLGPNTDYSSYMGVTPNQAPQYDPLSDMYFQAPTNYQPVVHSVALLIAAAISLVYIACTTATRAFCKSTHCSRLFRPRRPAGNSSTKK